MRVSGITLAALAFLSTTTALAPTTWAVGLCTTLDPRCPAVACVGTSWSYPDPYYTCQYEVPNRLPIVGATSNCGGISPLKNGCSGAGVLDDRWWVEIRSAGTFLGTVTAELATVTGSLTLACTLPRPTSGGVCVESRTGTLEAGQSYDLGGSVTPLPASPTAAGHWLISVYTAP